MIVPKFWAEGRVRERVQGRQVTVRRFGWSDSSQEDAQLNAESRARAALDRIIAGDKLWSREPKVPYGGADGVPIREEILSRHGNAIVTRNVYGARCLNTPNVLFADIDFGEPFSGRLLIVLSVLFTLVSCVVGARWNSWEVQMIGLIGTLISVPFIVSAWRHLFVAWHGGFERLALHRIESYLEQHRDWHVRIYRTPAGVRVLALHQTFHPHDPIVAEFFRAVHADPVYTRMCVNQNCFRARVSPKPWRIGINQHLRPRPGVWPITAERMPDRMAWVDAYEQTARTFAACRLITEFGSSIVVSETQLIQKLHDELCQAATDLPLG